MDQAVLDRAVDIATKSALNGHPVKRVVWIPPQKATDNPDGCFAVETTELLSASETPPWNKN